MKLRMRAILILGLLMGCSSTLSAQALPEGDQGLAAKYPGDVGLASDPQVIFAESFENSLEEVLSRWESAKGEERFEIDGDTPESSSGETSLLITHVGGTGDGGYLDRRFDTGYDKLHYRFYVKFDERCAPIHHFFHVGGYAPSTAWPQGGAGQRPRGVERFSTGVEPFGDEWRWDCYSYWMEMRGSPPRGQCWGNSFVRDPQFKVNQGEWQCLELMMKLNQVGQSDGEMALWLDGRLVTHLGPGFPRGKWDFDKFLKGEGGLSQRWNDENGKVEASEVEAGGAPFEGFRWRDSEDLQLNFLWLLCYITKAPDGHISHIRFDDIVVAQDYIGPITPAR